MEPTIKVLDNALRGDFGALSVLEKTASIYILDATNGLNATPITYGCWNFLNQALTEVERYEQQQQKQLYDLQSSQHSPHHGHSSVMPSLESHVQLLCSMSRKAARRPPPSDRRLIGICLSNAAKSYGNQLLSTPEAQKQMMDLNCQTRERVMGRIAAMVFDFSFHPSSTTNINTTTRGQFQSAFSNPVAMEGLCAILSANAISNGPSSIKEFVMDWIVPSVKHLPPFAVACIVLHLAKEVMEKSAPYGTEQELQNLSIAVVGNVLGPLLVDALRESDESNDNLTGSSSFSSSSVKVLTRNQRLATISLQALERWCCATNMNFVHLNHICNSTQINIVEVISDALYSHNDFILDAAAEFLATLLQQQDNSSTSVVERTTTTTTRDSSNHHYFLKELATAIGLQRFRFMERQAIGNNGTCRCLSRIASTIAISFRRNVTSNDDKEENIPDGLLDILLKATSHSVLNVSSIAIDALNFLLQSSAPHAQNVALSNRFLPILQEKSIYPNSVLNELTSTNDNDEDEDMTMTTSGDTNNIHTTSATTTTTESFQEFNEFRQNCLAEALCSCYIMNPQLYLESSANALESLCNSSSQINNQPTVTSTSQIEGVLFCLGVVSVEVTKQVTLTKQRQEEGDEAISFQNLPQDSSSSSSSSNNTDNLLNRCILALASAPSHPTSNPLTLAQMCNFLGKYADFIASESQSQIQMQTPKTNIILDSAADLSLRSFKLASTAFRDNKQTKNIMDKMSVSPFAEAAIALRNILSRKPSHFTTSHALTALAGAWESAYCDSSTTLSKASLGEKTPVYRVEDRKAISSGICRVLASLPSEQWVASLIALSRPTIENLEIAIRKADDLMLRHTTRRSGNDLSSSSSSASKDVVLNGILSRAAEEIVLLSTMTKTFNESTLIPQASGTTPAPAISVTFMSNENHNNQDQHKILPEEEGEKGPPKDHPSLALLRASWPCLSHLAKKYSSFDQINESLGEFLESSVSSSPGKNNKPHTNNSQTPSNSVSMIDHHGNGISILKELCDMAATITSVLTNNQLHNHDSSSSPLTPIFPFIIRVLETYGQEAELIKKNPSTNSPPQVVASSSQIIEIRLIIKRLLTITVESMSSSVGQLWLCPPTIFYGKKKENKNDHQQQQNQGQNPYECPSSPEQHEDKLSSPSHQSLQFSMNSVFMLPPASTSGESGGGKNTNTGAENNNRNKSAESLSRFFDILSCCIEKCPNLLINLERQFGDNQDGLLQKSVSVAILVMVEKEIDIARSSMIFLKSLIDLRYRLLSSKTMDMMVEEVKPSALSSSNTILLEDHMITHVITSRIRNNLIEKLLLGSFGNFSRESLDSAALLLLSLLRKEPSHDDNNNVDDDEDEEKDVNTAVLNICRGVSRNKQFVLGEGALTITMGVLQKCSDEKIPSDYLIEFLTDIWDMHQTDDIGSLAGGNVVKRFEDKYKVLLSS